MRLVQRSSITFQSGRRVAMSKVYTPNQLVSALPPTCLKVWQWMLGWQSLPSIIVYVNQYAKALNLTVEEVELAIETLVRANLISVSNVDSNWVVTLNAEQVQRYFDTDLKKVVASSGIKLADEVTWNREKSQQNEKEEGFGRFSTEDLKRMVLRLQAELNEREQVDKIVRSPSKNDLSSDLPF